MSLARTPRAGAIYFFISFTSYSNFQNLRDPIFIYSIRHPFPDQKRNIKPTFCQSGWGAFPRQKLLNVQVAFLNIDNLWFSLSNTRRGWRAPDARTWSRHLGESPAMFPRAHTLHYCQLTLFIFKEYDRRGNLRLFPHVQNWGREESDKVGDGTGLDDDLGVVGSTGGDVWISAYISSAHERYDILVRAQAASNYNHQLNFLMSMIRSLAYLKHGVLAGKELDESWYHTTFDNSINRRVLLLWQKPRYISFNTTFPPLLAFLQGEMYNSLPEFHSSIQLRILITSINSL